MPSTSPDDMANVAKLLAEAHDLLDGMREDDRTTAAAIELVVDELARVQKRVADLASWWEKQRPKVRPAKPKGWAAIVQVPMTVEVGRDQLPHLLAWAEGQGVTGPACAVQHLVTMHARALQLEAMERQAEDTEARNVAEHGPDWRTKTHGYMPPYTSR